MKIFSIRPCHIALILVLLLQPISGMAQSNNDLIESSQTQTTPDYGDPPYWTQWNPNMQALANGGDTVWIGGVGQVIRWEKSTNQYQHIQIPGSPPTQAILAAVVDSLGTRWFGGENGLYRLDINNQWTHFTTENSGLQSNFVNGLVAGADGIIWAIHGGPITRRNTDGSWRSYASNLETVTQDYADVLHTQSFSPLWEVAGNEVWTGLLVYNGSEWQDRSPTGVEYSLSYIVADRNQDVWALCSSICDLAKWNGSSWDEHSGWFDDYMSVYRLSSAPGSDIWADGTIAGPYGNPGSFIVNMTGPGGFTNLGIGPIVMVLPHPNGAWAVGTGLFYSSEDETSYSLAAPQYRTLTDILVDQTNTLWLHSFQPANWPLGAMQLLNDNATAVVGDDSWPVVDNSIAQAAEIDGFELSPNGDVWIAWYTRTRFPPFSSSITRRHQGEWIDYTEAVKSRLIRVTDIFAQDANYIWFAYKEVDYFAPAPLKGVLLLDDHGTPADLSDDIWTNYPVREDGTGGSVVVDAQGRIWFGNSTGLYRYDGSQWQSLSQCAIGDLAATAEGIVYAASSCDSAPSTILAVATDDSTLQFTIAELVESRSATLRTANRNHIWTIAPDGAIWYAKGTEIHRRDALGLQSYTTPSGEQGINAIEVDSNNHVWVVYQSSLWRMSAKPDFRLQPIDWLVMPGKSYTRSIQIGSIEGYSQPVDLQISGFPDNLKATFDPASAAAGGSVTLTVTVVSTTTLGTYSAIIIGVSDGVTHTIPLTLSVVSQVFDAYLPLVVR